MEFFGVIETAVAPVGRLQEVLTIANLARLCGSIDKVLADEGDRGVIYCLWGEFAVNRELIKDGVRFSLPYCPNALAWTVTQEEAGGGTLVHCTIARQTHDKDFVDSIAIFVGDWAEGLSAALA